MTEEKSPAQLGDEKFVKARIDSIIGHLLECSDLECKASLCVHLQGHYLALLVMEREYTLEIRNMIARWRIDECFPGGSGINHN